MADLSGRTLASRLDGTELIPVLQGADFEKATSGHFGEGFLNRLINGNGLLNERAAGSIADDVYGHDCHYALTQTAAITVSTLSDVADGLPSMMRLSQQQTTSQRMGYAQIIESRNCKGLRGKKATLLGKLRASASQAIRYAILEWTGTADAVVSDVVNDWTNGTFTPGNFFNATTLAVAAVGTITPAANTVTDFALTATLGSTFNNIIVMMWTEAVAAQNVTMDLAWEFVPKERAAGLYPVDPVDPIVNAQKCQRYYLKLVGVNVGDRFVVGFATNTTDLLFAFNHPVPFRVLPTAAFVDMSFTISGSTHKTVTSITSLWTSGVATGVMVVSSGLTSGNPGQIRFTSGSASYMTFDASL